MRPLALSARPAFHSRASGGTVMDVFATDYTERLERFVSRCQVLVGEAGENCEAALLSEVRQLVDHMPAWGLPVPPFLFRTIVAGVLLCCIRRATPDVRADLMPVLLDFTTARGSSADTLRVESLVLLDRCKETIGRAAVPPLSTHNLQRVLTLIDTRHCDANLTLREVSDELQLSLSHVSRLLNQHLGCGFRAHLNRLRISNAQRLLRNPALSVKEVAAAVGYRSTSELDRHFRRFCATTPALFRRTTQINSLRR